MLQVNDKFLQSLYGEDVIAFGTGEVGKNMIPYLAQEPSIKLHGVTNSRIVERDAGFFMDTEIPMRSLQTWAELMPDATILITVLNDDHLAEIIPVCREAGFHKVLTIPRETYGLVVRMAVTEYSVRQLESIVNNSSGMKLETNPMLAMLCLANEIKEANCTAFSEFRSCHKDETVAVVGTGPSLNYYTQIKRIAHIGVNASVLKKDLALDYYFLHDYMPAWRSEIKKATVLSFLWMIRPEYT